MLLLQISINDKNIKFYEITSLRKAISVLFQDYTLYAFTIRDNLTLGIDIDENTIIHVLSEVGLWEKISSLPLGLDTPLSNQLLENGIEFSSGEKQRLSIARLFLRGSDFYILDEPTSSLDSAIEQKIFELFLSKNEKTVVIITHQLLFADRMTKILFMKNGQIVEAGSHEELMKKDQSDYRGLYQRYLKKHTGTADHIFQ